MAKEGNLEEAKKAVSNDQATLEKEEADVKVANETFAKQKLEIMQQVLTNLHDIEKSYHEKAVELFGDVKEKAEAIKVEEEAKLEEQVPIEPEEEE